MCRGKAACEVLGTDVSKWSKICPLPLPDYFEESLTTFSQAVAELAGGNIEKSIEKLKECKSEAVGSFFIEHGQQSAYFRVSNRKEIDAENRPLNKSNKTPRLLPKVEKQVFIRDSYRCRYCGLRIISKEIFAQYSRIVGANLFSVQRKNSLRNGLTLGLRGVADHVEPYASGGETRIENLVTSCYSCNFGKAGYTFEQLGLEDPRCRPPAEDDWQGLTEYLPALKGIK